MYFKPSITACIRSIVLVVSLSLSLRLAIRVVGARRMDDAARATTDDDVRDGYRRMTRARSDIVTT